MCLLYIRCNTLKQTVLLMWGNLCIHFPVHIARLHCIKFILDEFIYASLDYTVLDYSFGKENHLISYSSAPDFFYINWKVWWKTAVFLFALMLLIRFRLYSTDLTSALDFSMWWKTDIIVIHNIRYLLLIFKR